MDIKIGKITITGKDMLVIGGVLTVLFLWGYSIFSFAFTTPDSSSSIPTFPLSDQYERGLWLNEDGNVREYNGSFREEYDSMKGTKIWFGFLYHDAPIRAFRINSKEGAVLKLYNETIEFDQVGGIDLNDFHGDDMEDVWWYSSNRLDVPPNEYVPFELLLHQDGKGRIVIQYSTAEREARSEESWKYIDPDMFQRFKKAKKKKL